MSYILDALKKSERQRPPGQVPDLFTVQGPLSSGKPGRPLRTAAVVASIVVIAALGGWAWFEARDRQAPAPPAQSAAPKLPASGGEPREAAAPAVPVAATPAAISQPAQPPAEKIPAAVSPAPFNAGGRTPGARATRAEIIGTTAPAATVPAALRTRHIPGAVEELDEGPPAQTAVPPSPEPTATTIPAAAPPPAVISPVTAAPAAQVPDVVAVPVVVPVRAPNPTPAAVVAEPAASPRQPADDAPPTDGRIMSIEELPQSVRNDLGTFVVSGHIWSEEPALRMLTVQDRIVREGGEAAPGVRLEEITQTGAVFTVRGWRFRTGF